MSPDEYHAYVTMLAENGLQMGESPRFVARASIIYPERVEDEQTVLFSAEPFVDDPSTQTRLWPKDVLLGTENDWSSVHCNNLRSLAVEVLVKDLYTQYERIENSMYETPPNAVALADGRTPEEAEQVREEVRQE